MARGGFFQAGANLNKDKAGDTEAERDADASDHERPASFGVLRIGGKSLEFEMETPTIESILINCSQNVA